MKIYFRILAILLVMTTLLGCRTFSTMFSTPSPSPDATMPPAPTAPAAHLPALNGDWRVTLTQSGGIMGMSRMVEILSSGETTFTDLRSNKTTQSQLSAQGEEALAGLVLDTVYSPVNVPSGCADCFIFDLVISSGGEEFQVQLNQLDLPDSGLEPLVNFLLEEMNNAVK